MATVHAILHPSDELPLCKRKTGRRALVGEPLGHDDLECPDCAGRVWAGIRMLLIRLRGQKPRKRSRSGRIVSVIADRHPHPTEVRSG